MVLFAKSKSALIAYLKYGRILLIKAWTLSMAPIGYSRILLLVPLLFSDYCLADKADQILHQELHALVGNHYKNCGTYPYGEDLSTRQFSKVSACLSSAYRAGKAFILSQEGYGTDSYSANGVLGLPNLGGIYNFHYDSSPSGRGCCNYAFGLSLCHEQNESTNIDIEVSCGLKLKALPPTLEEEKTPSKQTECALSRFKAPRNFTIFAAGNYSGRELGVQLKGSDREANQFDVTVNYQQNPINLILAAYEPSIWNIRWTDKTEIAAVVISGYYRQEIAGLPTNVPILNTSGENAPCGQSFNISDDAKEIKTLESLSRRLFARTVDKIFLAQEGTVLVGEPFSEGTTFKASRHSPPESFINKNAPTGSAGIERAVRMGLLRAATQDDINAWVTELMENTPKKDIPPIAGKDTSAPDRPSVENAYIVLKPFVFPANLISIFRTFYVPRGIAIPKGDPGDSNVCDFNTMECHVLWEHE